MRRLTLCLATLLATAFASATAVVERSLAEMLDRADAIAYGQVAEVRADADEDGEIRTRVVLEVDRDLGAPDDPREELVLSFLGGRTATGDTVLVDGVPAFETGERVLVLAYEADEDEAGADGEDEDVDAPRLASPIVGVWQGVWRLGPAGLSDARGRLLTPTPEGLSPDGSGGDLTEVLDAIAAFLDGDAEIAPAPATEGAGPAPERPASGPTDAPVAGGQEEPPAEVDADAEPSEMNPEDADPAGDDPPEDGPVDDDAREGDPTGPDPDAADPVRADPESAASADPPQDSAADADEALRVLLRPPENDPLRRTIEAAAAAWRDVGADLNVEFDAAAPNAIVLGDAERLGPDALSLTVARSGVEGREVLVHPEAATRSDVAAFELAALAGAGTEAPGLLSGRFDATRETALTAADARALRASLERVPGDLDGDGDVDFYDLVRFGEQHGRSGPRVAADFDDSGRVDDEDLRRLREGYEFLPPAPEAPPGFRATDD